MADALVLSPCLVPPCPLTGLAELNRIAHAPDIPRDMAFAHEYIHSTNLLKDLGYACEMPFPPAVAAGLERLAERRYEDAAQIRDQTTKLHYLREIFLLNWIFGFLNREDLRKKLEARFLKTARRGLLSKMFANYTIVGLEGILSRKETEDPLDAYSYLKTFLFWRRYDQGMIGALAGGLGDLGQYANRLLDKIVAGLTADPSGVNRVLLHRLLTGEDRRGDMLFLENSRELGAMLTGHLDAMFAARDIAGLRLYGAYEIYRDRLRERLVADIRGRTAPEALERVAPEKVYVPDLHRGILEQVETERRAVRVAGECLAGLRIDEGLDVLAKLRAGLDAYGLTPMPETTALEEDLHRARHWVTEMEALQRSVRGLLQRNRFQEADDCVAVFAWSEILPGFERYRGGLEETIRAAVAAFDEKLAALEARSLPEAWLMYEANRHIQAVRAKYEELTARLAAGTMPARFRGEEAVWLPVPCMRLGRMDDADVVLGNLALSRAYVCFTIRDGRACIEVLPPPDRGAMDINAIDITGDACACLTRSGEILDLGRGGEIVFTRCFALEYEVIQGRLLALRFKRPDERAVRERMGCGLDQVWADWRDRVERWILVGR